LQISVSEFEVARVLQAFPPVSKSEAKPQTELPPASTTNTQTATLQDVVPFSELKKQGKFGIQSALGADFGPADLHFLQPKSGQRL
jgi:hypothetical protein